jgi:hypothetical protein
VTIHELKCWPEFFSAVARKTKPFEVRKADRVYAVGDALVLREWDPATGLYTSQETARRVIYVLPGGQFGIESGYVVLGLE